MLFDWRGEDSGPNVNSADDVLKLYAQARAKFPNATVRSGGLDDVAESLMRPDIRSKLPVLDLEVGDTWAYGIQSDPRKVANVRAAIRHRAAFEAAEKQQVTLSGITSPILTGPTPFNWWSNFSRCLLKGFEHTWGLRYAPPHPAIHSSYRKCTGFMPMLHGDMTRASCAGMTCATEAVFWGAQRHQQ